ncbi:hypothetical protein CA13_41480 [Planctomycetes bacterium CA13]|uniref:TIGR00341 family protein n=1 Tax=Novipirellula herctigrandis TaxID=2527986 RepID=A0A5C5Z652_9BACT|nr:hypothetical protein CA13_41480 [Planctomycetes bacterium CA13]
MPLRLIEIVLPANLADALESWPNGDSVVDRWQDMISDDRMLVRVLVEAEHVEAMLDEISRRFSTSDHFRVLLLSVEATLPRPTRQEKEATEKSKKSLERISREELFDDISQGARISRVFIAQTVLATLVAAIGLLRNDTAIIIGAMVIAPLLGPNVSLCLATALGDINLAKVSLKTNAAGLSIALFVSLLIGSMFLIDPTIPSIAARTEVALSDIILALAAGCAGVLAFTTGAPASLIGVMVAVALLPPFAVFGLLLASGEYHAASGALLLTATNVICVNLAGVLTLAVQGLRPRNWWEAKRAKKATRIAIAMWAILLAILFGLIFVASER